ncbi:unnamed protein product, partial [Aphanomyces euteiches]
MKLCVAAYAVVVLSAISSSYTDARSLRVADTPAMHLSFLDEGAPTRIGNDAVDGSMIARNLEAAGKKKHKKHKKSKHEVAAPEEGESARLLKEEMAMGKKKYKKHKKSKHEVAAPEEGESARLLKEEMAMGKKKHKKHKKSKHEVAAPEE